LKLHEWLRWTCGGGFEAHEAEFAEKEVGLAVHGVLGREFSEAVVLARASHLVDDCPGEADELVLRELESTARWVLRSRRSRRA